MRISLKAQLKRLQIEMRNIDASLQALKDDEEEYDIALMGLKHKRDALYRLRGDNQRDQDAIIRVLQLRGKSTK